MNSSLLWKRQQLPNGLRVLLYNKPSRLTAQIAVAVEYGARDDIDAQAGSAHFLEHMVPGGSEKRIILSRQVEQLGGFSDFYTNQEYTLSMIDVPPKKLQLASKIMSGLLLDGAFEEKQFRSERKIIFNELAEVADDPNEKVNEMLRQCLFKSHPVRRPIGGYIENVRQLSLPCLTEVYLQRYAPQNMILVLSGNYSQQDIETVTAAFAFNTMHKAVRREKLSPETSIPQKQVVKKKAGLNQTYMTIGARTTSSTDPDVPALDVLNVILGFGASSRLFIEMREKRGLAYSINSAQTDGLDFGYFSIECALKEKNAKKAIELILKEISNLRNKTVTEDELNKGKDMILGDALRGMDDAESCPEILAIMEMRFGNETALEDYVTRVKAVNATEVRDVANKYLQEDDFATAILTPKKD